jgi:predicted DNA-binding transcriptional regulator AlpA
MSQAALKTRPVDRPVTLPQLAEMLGVHRQRIYLMRQKGLFKAVRLMGGLVVMPDEVNRVLGSATSVDSPKGSRVLFNLNDTLDERI